MGGRVVVVAGCVGAGALLSWWVWRRIRYPETPWRWEEVGEVGELIVYPLASARGVKVTEAEATRYGLAVDLMEDRSFAVVCPNRVYYDDFNRGMFGVALTLDGSMVTLSCKRGEEEEEEVEFDLQDVIMERKVVDISDWTLNGKWHTSVALKGYDCGDEVAAWLTRVMHPSRIQESFRLVYSGGLVTTREPEKVLRFSPHQSYIYRLYKPSDRLVYGMDAAFMLTSETSLADLNRRLLKKVTQEWFRPNLVVRGVQRAYDEDDWAFVRIGDVVLRRVKPCTRHLRKFSDYVNPGTGLDITEQEDHVLNETILSTRKVEGPDLLQLYWRRNPVFGVDLGIDSCGKVRMGDKVEVARVSSNPRWQL